MALLKKIAADSVHRICSGQVVLSLAVAVKELVENSLDAGANNIEIRLKHFGAESVEVADNGAGISPDNYQALTLKHFTSKIADFSDVATVETFGFRGEALSSLCALSDLVVVTCHKDQVVGSRITYDNEGTIRNIANCARQQGTTVVLSNLFHTLPVRRKEFSRNIKKEFAKMIRVLQGYCLVLENVKITCYNETDNGKRQLVLSTVSSSRMVDNISCLFGSKQVSQVVPIVQGSCDIMGPSSPKGEESPLGQGAGQPSVTNGHNSLFRIKGYVSKCTHGCGRSSCDRQYFSFNQRPCDHPKLAKVVNEVYHGYNRHQYPFVTMDIAMDRERVDVNLTPDKRSIMIHEEKVLLDLIKESLVNMYEPMQSEVETTTPNLTTPVVTKQTTPSNLVTPTIDQITDTTSDITTSSTLTTPLSVTPITDTDSGCVPNSSPSHSTDDAESPIKSFKRSSDYSSSKTSSPNLFSKPLKQPKLTSFATSRTTPPNYPFIHSTTESTKAKPVSSTSNKRAWPTDKHSPVKMASNSSSGRVTIATPTNGAESLADRSTDDRRGIGCHGDESVAIDIDLIAVRQEHLLKGRGNGDGCGSGSGWGFNKKYFHAKINPSSNALAEEELKRELSCHGYVLCPYSKESFRDMEIIGQFNVGFIIAKLGNHLFIIDQHATDEKYNYERLQRDTVIDHQTLIQPLPLELTVVGESVVMENEEVFEKNGFKFVINEEDPPTKRVKLIGQPVSKNWSMGVSEIEELIFVLTDYPGEMVRPSCVNRMFASRACRGSIMIGTPLNHKEMKRLLVHMSDMKQPWNCPHGRPTLRHLVDLSRLN